MALQRDCLADSRLAPFWVRRRVVPEFTTLNRSMLRPATGHSAGQSGMAIEEFGSDHAFKFVIDYTKESERCPRPATFLGVPHSPQLRSFKVKMALLAGGNGRPVGIAWVR